MKTLRRGLLIVAILVAVVVVVPDPCAWVPWFMRSIVGCTCNQGGGGSAAGGGCSGASELRFERRLHASAGRRMFEAVR